MEKTRARYFMAIVEGTEESGFSVFFPDLPGCTSGGDTPSEATRNAEEALSFHLRGMIEDGQEIPQATDPTEIVVDPEVREVGRLLVRGEISVRAGDSTRLSKMVVPSK